MLRPQHFYDKSQVVSCYWFKFKFSTEIIIFNLTITTSNNLLLKICCKMLWTYHFSKKILAFKRLCNNIRRSEQKGKVFHFIKYT